MTTELELEPVASVFKEWRFKNKKSSIPSDFKQKILQLSESYSLEQLAHTLGMSRRTLKRWRHAQQKQLAPEAIQFVPLQLESPSTEVRDAERQGAKLQGAEVRDGEVRKTEVFETVAGLRLSVTLPNSLILELQEISLSQAVALMKSFSSGGLSGFI